MGKLIVEGRLISSAGESYAQVVINRETGLIEAVGAALGKADLQASRDQLIFAGFGDIHIHAREDATGKQSYKEDFATASEAAIAGSVVHVADMPNNPRAPVDDERYLEKRALSDRAAVHFTLYAGIGPNTQPLKLTVPYKAYMGPSVGDLFFTSGAQLEETIQRYRGQNVSFHCEDPELLEASKGAPTHEARRPREAELLATDFALQLIEKYELRGKLCHYSVGEGLERILAAKRRGVTVTCEVTPHHLYFDSSHLQGELHRLLQMNPPIRSREDRLRLIEGLRNGEIDYLATDHAPHTLEEKGQGMSGVPQLDTYGAFVTWLLKAQQFTPQQIARVCSLNPGRFVNEFSAEKFGEIKPGFVGSLSIIDPQSPQTIERAVQRTKCGWSPFEGVTFPGRVVATVVRGRVYKR